MTKRDREARASEELAAALDAVSSPMAERILGRAIELDAAGTNKETFDYAELRTIADEVGISETALRKALLEEVDTDKDLNPDVVERITIPRTVRGGILVEGRQEAIRQRLEDTMRRLHAAQYEVIPQRQPERSLVEITSRTGNLGRRALVFMALLFILGPVLAQAIASALFLALAVAAAVGVFTWIKRLGRRIRRSVNTALNSLLEGDGEPGSWLDVWERSRR
jgi:hypothetical protein